jgi:hypothetical protein
VRSRLLHPSSQWERVLALAVGLLLVVYVILLLWSLGTNPRPMWDEAYYLWSATRFGNVVQANGLLYALTHYESMKPWLMELLYLPYQLIGRASILAHIVPSTVALLVGTLVLFTAARQKYSFLPSVAIGLLFPASYRMNAFALSTQPEIFACLGVLLFIFGIVVRTVRSWWSVIPIALGIILLLLAKQYAVVFVAGLYGLLLFFGSGTIRDRLRVATSSALLAALVVGPLYYLNIERLAGYAQEVSTLLGGTFLQFLKTFLLDTLGLPMLLALLAVLLGFSLSGKLISGWKIAAIGAVIGGWILFFGIAVSHNVFKYIVPAVPMMAALPIFLFEVERPGRNVSRWPFSISIIFSAISMLIVLSWLYDREVSIAQQRVAFHMSKVEYCNSHVTTTLPPLLALPSTKRVVGVIGDHAFLNYSTVSMDLERAGTVDYAVRYISVPGPIEQVTSPDLGALVIVGIFDHHQLVEKEALLAFVAHPQVASNWDEISSCRTTDGLVRVLSRRS